MLHAKERRDPRGYIIPSDQPDFLTAIKFVNTLRHVGVYVEQATQPFSVAGKQYPANSFVIKNNQAARAQVLDMMEPQDHPNDFAYPGGPPRRPYDNAGWTLAYEMGVKFDRILDGFDVPNTHRMTGTELAKPTAGTVANAAGAAGYLMSHEENDAFTVINRVFKAGGEVYWLKSPMQAGGKTFPAGTFFVPAASMPVLQKSAADLGVSFVGTNSRPADAVKLSSKRIALADRYGGSMSSGWTRYEFEKFEIPFEVVYPKDLDAGNLKSKYDVIIFPSDMGDRRRRRTWRWRWRRRWWRRPRCGRRDPGRVPGDAGQLDDGGDAAGDQAIPERRRHGDHGGSRDVARLRPRAPDRESPAGAVAGSAGPCARRRGVLRAGFDPARGDGPDALVKAGVPQQLDVFFDNSPVFRLKPDAAIKGDEGGCVVRFRDAAAVRLGVGPELSRGRRGGGRVELREGEGLPVRSGDHVPRPAARDVQVSVQWHLCADDSAERRAVKDGCDEMQNARAICAGVLV